MSNRAREFSWRDLALVLVSVLAVFSLALSVYLRSRALEARSAAETARQRLAEDSGLAARYLRASERKLVFSKDKTEANSEEFIAGALGAHGVKTENVLYGDPGEEATGKYALVENKIDVKSATFAGLVSFLRQVETERPQLSLLSADVDGKGKDNWSGQLVYVAFIPATPRN
ncbi:MAG: hypothetical protein ACYTAN_12160 [Planctomycetota bacterium]